MTNPNLSIGNLNELFAPQQAMAEAAQQNALQQTLLGTKGDKLAALMFRQPAAAPSLKFDTNATNAGTGIVQGIGNAVNNAMQMRQYGQANQQRQQLYDLAQQRDLAAQQDAQRQANELETYIKAQPEAVQPHLRALSGDQEGFRSIVKDLAYPGLGAAKGQGAGAEETAKQNAIRGQKETQFQEMMGMPVGQFFQALNAGQATPQQQATYKYVFGSDAPADLLDYNKRRNEAANLAVETQAKPTLTAQEIEQNNLGMQSERLNNILKQIQINFEPERLKANIQGQHLTNQDKADRLTRVDTAVQVFNAFQERLARGEVTPQDITQMQSAVGMLTKLDPSIDTTLKNVMGLKADDKLDSKKVQDFFKVQTSPTSGYRSLGSGYFQDPKTGKIFRESGATQQKTAPARKVSSVPATLSAAPGKEGAAGPPGLSGILYSNDPFDIKRGIGTLADQLWNAPGPRFYRGVGQ